MKPIRNLNTLRMLERAGHIKLHAQTGKIVVHNGQKVRANYVSEGQPVFQHKGKTYKTVYWDGCFYPFIYEVTLMSDLHKLKEEGKIGIIYINP